eukprot:4214900-Alexandrium_andersonii.AAC.1
MPDPTGHTDGSEGSAPPQSPAGSTQHGDLPALRPVPKAMLRLQQQSPRHDDMPAQPCGQDSTLPSWEQMSPWQMHC